MPEFSKAALMFPHRSFGHTMRIAFAICFVIGGSVSHATVVASEDASTNGATNAAAETATKQEHEATVEAAIQSIVSRREATWQMAQKIWAFAEPGYQESQSSALLADAAEAAGLKVTRGVADIPTAFTAEFGSGAPVIGILGEFDALPGCRNRRFPSRCPLKEAMVTGTDAGTICLQRVVVSDDCGGRTDQVRSDQRNGSILRMSRGRGRQCQGLYGSGGSLQGLRCGSSLASIFEVISR